MHLVILKHVGFNLLSYNEIFEIKTVVTAAVRPLTALRTQCNPSLFIYSLAE